MQISALVIARNEEKNIIKCLESLKFADEIIVVLDRSSDRTEEYSKIYTKKTFSGNWEFEGDRRNFGITKCSHEWILEIDADEIISKQLAKEIKIKINQNKYDYFYIKLINYIYKKKIVGGWMACLAPDGKFCLFRRQNKKWNNKKVHPDYRIFGKKGKEFKNSIDHMMSKNIFELINRFNRNTSLHAEDLFDQKTNLKKNFSKRKILSRFIKCFLIRRGFKNGGIGLLVALLCSFYPYVSGLKTKWLFDIKD
tara:strand:+ start:374 stop:1132 length:759 start_codon:yes stop_codon:yes gene_type:complete